jgi:hypothetical protein
LSADKVFDVIEAINEEFPHDESLLEFADGMRKDNLGKLLKNDRFRARLDNGGKKMLWQVLDDLIFAADLNKKWHHLCISCKDVVFRDVGVDGPRKAFCGVCDLQGLNLWATETMDHTPASIVWTLD